MYYFKFISTMTNSLKTKNLRHPQNILYKLKTQNYPAYTLLVDEIKYRKVKVEE